MAYRSRVVYKRIKDDQLIIAMQGLEAKDITSTPLACHCFMLKVLTIIALFTAIPPIICVFIAFETGVLLFIQFNDAWMRVQSAITLLLFLLMILHRNNWPYNILLILTGLAVFPICSLFVAFRYDLHFIIGASQVVTCTLFVLLLFGLPFKYLHKKKQACAASLAVCTCFITIFQMIFHFQGIDFWLFVVISLLMTLFAICNTERLLRKFSVDDYVPAAIGFFVDPLLLLFNRNDISQLFKL